MEYPDDALQPRDPAEIDAFEAETLLVQAWRAFVRLRGEVIANPPSMLEVPQESSYRRIPARRSHPGLAWHRLVLLGEPTSSLARSWRRRSSPTW